MEFDTTIIGEDLPRVGLERPQHGSHKPDEVGSTPTPATIRPLKDIEREYIERTLEHFGGDKPKAAASLGIALKTLYNRAHEYGLMKSKGNNARTRIAPPRKRPRRRENVDSGPAG